MLGGGGVLGQGSHRSIDGHEGLVDDDLDDGKVGVGRVVVI